MAWITKLMEWASAMLVKYGELLGGLVPVTLLAALAGVVRSMQCGKTGLKAVSIAATSAAFAGLIVHLLLSETGMPASLRAAMVGISGYASGELLKILSARVCKWAEAYVPAPPKGPTD